VVKVVKWSTSGQEIDDQEIDDGQSFEPYDGPLPPKNTILLFDVKWIKLAKFKSGSRGLKALLVANSGDDDSPKAKYDGLPLFDNLVDVPQNAWKTRQFMDSIGGTGADWDKTQAEDPGGEGSKVVKFGRIRTEGLQVKVSVQIGANQDGDSRAEVGRYLPKDAGQSAKASSTKASGRRAAAADDPDDDEAPPF
jgi:hypothetical protein